MDEINITPDQMDSQSMESHCTSEIHKSETHDKLGSHSTDAIEITEASDKLDLHSLDETGISRTDSDHETYREKAILSVPSFGTSSQAKRRSARSLIL